MTAPTQTRTKRRTPGPRDTGPRDTRPRALGPSDVGRLNDVDLEAVTTLVERVTEDPATARTVWSAESTWKGGFRSSAQIRGFSPTASDEPGALGGDDTAANPVEQLLAALGNCLVVGYAAQASAQGIRIHELRVRVTGDLDLHSFLGLREGHAGFRGINAAVHLRSDATRAQLVDLHEHVVGTSPVGHTLAAAIPVRIHLA